MWTVYDHPSDFPDVFIARRSEVHGGGVLVTTGDIVTSPKLKDVRHEMRLRGLVCIDRQEDDYATIVEVWL